MVLLKSCWSPCIMTDNLKAGCIAIAFYTAAISIVLMTFLIFDLTGGDSTQLYNPFFELSFENDAKSITVGVVVFIYFVLLIIFAALMVVGIRTLVRGLMVPWMVTFGLAILFQLIFGLWLLGGYYIYLDTVFYTFVIWCWMAYNIYCWLVVYSEFKFIEEMQSPKIELLWPYYN